LLESVRSEDLRRYQTLILNSLGFKTKIDPQMVNDQTKKKIKFYGEQAQDRILGPEPVFRGFLVSTLTCLECHHTSSRHESFLDISLPVFVEKSQPPMRRKNSPDVEQQSAHAAASAATESGSILDTNPSPKKAVNKKLERQMKKKQKAEALQKLKQKNQQEFFRAPSGTPLVDPIGSGDGGLEPAATNRSNSSSSIGSGEQSDADVEDNLNDESAKNNSEDLDENGNPKKGDPPPPLLFDEAETELLAATENHLLELSLSTEGKENLIKKIDNISLTDAAKPATKAKKIDWSATLGQRYHCKDGECSIESCFNNFTATELMTGSNKVGCEACTERINGKNGKTINTNATKQFLISSPPGVLILHLKRFQVGPKHIFRKINKHVEFPLILDIAPFCGMKVKNLPNINPNQKKLLYELYGIVEHSGGMRGGHYVAYIKVRAKFDRDDPKWKFLPKGSKAECDQIDEHKAQIERMLTKEQQRNHANPEDSDDLSTTSSTDDLEGAVGGTTDGEGVTKSPGKWYYVSDSFVKETSEENVLKAEAYLLFYERVY
jgi:ubiquitin carboxyl-terminal hydrolase 16/45